MFDKYKEVAPTRFLNCGIAEANMMSMAAGMALNGLKPVVYTITHLLLLAARTNPYRCGIPGAVVIVNWLRSILR